MTKNVKFILNELQRRDRVVAALDALTAVLAETRQASVDAWQKASTLDIKGNRVALDEARETIRAAYGLLVEAQQTLNEGQRF